VISVVAKKVTTENTEKKYLTILFEATPPLVLRGFKNDNHIAQTTERTKKNPV
jgi:hypothetical protein